MIRTKILHGEVDILLIDGLPEDATSIKILMGGNERNNLLYWHNNASTFVNAVWDSVPGNWKPVNWLDKVTEEESYQLVGMHKVSNNTWRFANYHNLSGKWFDTPKESLLSLVESEVKIKNLLCEEPEAINYHDIKCGAIEWAVDRGAWCKEEAQVWKNIYLLKRI